MPLLRNQFLHCRAVAWRSKRMPVLVAVGDGESRLVGKVERQAVYNLSYHRQRLHGPRTHAWARRRNSSWRP